VQDDHRIWTKNYNLAKEEINSIVQRYEYTAVFFFNKDTKTTVNINNDDSNKILQMCAKAVCPKICFSTQHLDFGECHIGDNIDLNLTVNNKNEESSPVTIDCPNLSQFITNPKKFILKSGEHRE
jgi:hypothetical protein